jgi:peptidoglycan/LPS O-acetylase OafA/YrhL
VRNRYLDLLRAAAIVRVIVYHLFGWPWLSLLLPAMGVMFALAGSLAAGSLEKRSARKVVVSRLRRLLPPLWLLGLLAVPVMLVAGWASERNGEHPFDPGHAWHLVFWLFPLGDPPGSDRAADVWDPLWYIRAYVWFLLLSPLMWLAYRKIGWFAVAAPIVGIVVLDKTGFSLPDTADSAMWDFVTFGACWMAGFAHHDGRLRRIGPRTLVFTVLVLGLAALYWQQGHQGEEHWDLNDVPESQALWSIAFVLLALRWEPSMTWLPRVRPLDRLVTLLNARAVTIYLWHNLAITAVWPVLGLVALGGVTFDDIGHDLDGPVDLTTALVLTLLAVLAFGWVEDLAAKRRPRLWPTTAPTLRQASAPPEEVVPALVGAYPLGGGMAARPDLPPAPGFALTPGLPSAPGLSSRPALPSAPAFDSRPDLPSAPGLAFPSSLPGGPSAGPELPAGPDLSDRPDLPDFRDRPSGHASAAAAMHRESFRRQAPRSVPWAADLPAPGAGPAGGISPTGIGRAADIGPAGSVGPTAGISPTDIGRAADIGPGATGRAAGIGSATPIRPGGDPGSTGAIHPTGGPGWAGSGWAGPNHPAYDDRAAAGRGRSGDAGRPVAAGRHAAAETLDLSGPPDEWPPARPAGGGVPDWFRQRRDATDSDPE